MDEKFIHLKIVGGELPPELSELLERLADAAEAPARALSDWVRAHPNYDPEMMAFAIRMMMGVLGGTLAISLPRGTFRPMMESAMEVGESLRAESERARVAGTADRRH